MAASNINNDYASVVSQTGLFAGKGGLNVTVGGNTSLTGAVISSLAPANDNTLNTGTLTVSNLDNHRDNSAVSMTASASSSGTGSGGGVAQTSDSAHSTTLSAITSNVGVTVRNGSVPSNLLRPDQLTANTSLGTVTGGIAVNGGTALQTTNGLQNKFDPQQTRNDLTVQNGFTQLGMMVSGEVAKSYRDKADRDVQAASEKLEKDRRNGADSSTLAADESDLKNKQATADFWSGYGSGLMHMVVAGTGAALGGGNVAGAMAGSAAGDAASGALSGFTGQVTADLPAWLRPIATNIVTSTVSGVAGGIAGSAVGGSGGTLSGAGAAMSADQFNRQLHPVELDRIRQLANGDPEREAALTAAACALVKCYAEYAEGSQEYIFWKSIADVGASSGYADLRNQLSSQTAFFQGGSAPGHSPSAEQALFGYSASDAAIDALSAFDSGHGQVLTKGMATLQVAGGYTAAVTGRALTISGITSCAASFGSGCMVAAGGIVLSGWAADQVAAGLMTISGHPTGTFGAQALVSVFGMSPGAAELLYGMAGGAAASAAGSARQIPGTVIVKDGEMTVVGQPGVQVKGYGSVTGPFTYNTVENPGPLASLPGNPAANFMSGKYNSTVLTDDIVLYRAGDAGAPLGQWFTREPPSSVPQVRIDSAVKPQWIDPKTGVLTGVSNINTVYAVKIPKGTTIYEGPVGNQGGVYLGGYNKDQIFIQTPWNIEGVQVLGSTPIK